MVKDTRLDCTYRKGRCRFWYQWCLLPLLNSRWPSLSGHGTVPSCNTRSGDILVGCKAGCDSAPCMNGAVCEEHWTSYTCHCANSVAHFGENCQHSQYSTKIWKTINTLQTTSIQVCVRVTKVHGTNAFTVTDLNADLVHILEKSSYLQFDQGRTEPDLLNSNILFSFRTTQPAALLLYMHDELNNFIQLEMVDEAILALRYNSWDSVHAVNMTLPRLNDGTWQQVSMSLQPDVVHLMVNAHQATFPVDREKLTSFDQTPFDNGLPGKRQKYPLQWASMLN